MYTLVVRPNRNFAATVSYAVCHARHTNFTYSPTIKLASKLCFGWTVGPAPATQATATAKSEASSNGGSADASADSKAVATSNGGPATASASSQASSTSAGRKMLSVAHAA